MVTKIAKRRIIVTILYVKTIAAIAAGFLAGQLAVYIFNRMPASWLCDYGEEPPEILKDRQVQRVKGWPWRWIYSGGLACLCLRLMYTQIHHPPAGFDGLPENWIQLLSQSQFTLAGLAACWAMLIIGLADLKYMIIPDQFVIMLAIAGMGFLPFHESLLQSLGGLAVGGGVMLITALLGKLAFHREVMGFGDVKLAAAMGLGLGLRGMIFALAAASIISGFAAAIGLARKRYQKYDMQPFGPFLTGAGIFYIFIVWPFMV